jgi:hypothetical protein
VGTEPITLSVFDGYSTASTSTKVVVLQPQPPTFGTIPNQHELVDSSLVVSLPVTSPNIPFSQLTFTASYDSSFVTNVTFSNSGTAASATVDTGAKTGTTVVGITVFDGWNTASTNFTLLVGTPGVLVLSPIATQAAVVNVSPTITLGVASPNVPLSGVTFTSSHTNTALVTNIGLSLVGANEQVLISLGNKQVGTDYITITANDGYSIVSQSFVLDVTGPPIKPTVTSGSLGLGFTAAPNSSWAIQSATSLFGPWTTVATVQADANGIVKYVATLNAASHGQFFRALAQ